MRIRSPLPPERSAVAALIAEGPFRPEEVSCALELLDAALARDDTYEALIAVEPGSDADARGSGGDDGGGVPVAYVCFGATPMTAATYDVYWIVVARAVQGRGIGRALLAETERLLSARGARIVRIETSSLEGEGGAVRFYERAGYAHVGLIEGFYRPGDDLVTLAKRLS